MSAAENPGAPVAGAQPPRGVRGVGRRLVEEAHALDHAVYDAVATTPTPTLDGPITWFSNAANYSRLWVAIAAGIAATGGPRGRRAALRALSVLGVTSAATNLAVKQMVPRRRPERSIATPTREARMPTSSSFPSGHTASAFGFATAVTADYPLLAAPLFGLATIVGYSRVHTGVHFPTDVIGGAILGVAVGTLATDATLHLGPLSRRTSA